MQVLPRRNFARNSYRRQWVTTNQNTVKSCQLQKSQKLIQKENGNKNIIMPLFKKLRNRSNTQNATIGGFNISFQWWCTCTSVWVNKQTINNSIQCPLYMYVVCVVFFLLIHWNSSVTNLFEFETLLKYIPIELPKNCRIIR